MDRPKAPVLHVAVSDRDQETIQCLREMLAQAESGRLIGIAFAVMYTGGRYCVDSAGEARRSPTFARGMVGELDMDLHGLILDELRRSRRP